MFRAIPNHTLADNSVIQDLISALQSGPESAQQQGTLMDLITQTKTAYTRLHGITGAYFKVVYAHVCFTHTYFSQSQQPCPGSHA
jgi:hypothetical protein